MFPIDPQRTNIKTKYYPSIIGYDHVTGAPLFGIAVDAAYKCLVRTTPAVFPVDPVRSMVWCDQCGGKCLRAGDIFDAEDEEFNRENICYTCLHRLESHVEINTGLCKRCLYRPESDIVVGYHSCSSCGKSVRTETDAPITTRVYCSIECASATNVQIAPED